MGNFSSRRRSRAEREQMKEDIKQLSMILQSLQRELSHFKTRSVETERQMSNTEKDLIREANGCAQKLHDMQDMFGRSFGRLESDLHGLRRKCEESDHSYCLDKKGIFKQIEAQELKGEELRKCVLELKNSFATLKDFKTVKTAIEMMESTMEQEKDRLEPTVQKFIHEKSAQWNKDVVNVMNKFQDMQADIVQLVTFDCAHERDIIGIKKRLDRIENANRPSLFEEDLAEPSLPSIEKLKPVHSEARNITARFPMSCDMDDEDYRLKFSTISAIMKRRNEEMNADKDV